MTTPLLNVNHLSVHLPGPSGKPLPVIHDASITVNEGEIVGIAGESGSGKSMTAQALLGLLPPDAIVGGTAELDGIDLLSLTRDQWNDVRGGQIAMVFQDATAALHPMLTVERQLTEHMRLHLGLDKKAARNRAIELLDMVQIPGGARALKSYPHHFSGGMRQRIAIASALACNPKLLIADEPTTALDVTVQAGILEIFDDLSRTMGLSVIFVTHDLAVLSALTTRSYVFYAGRVMETAPTSDLLHHPQHPYTQALLSARPHVEASGTVTGARSEGRLQTIPGIPATPATAGPGCPFAPRCSLRVPQCEEAVPPMVPVGPAWANACIRAEGVESA